MTTTPSLSAESEMAGSIVIAVFFFVADLLWVLALSRWWPPLTVDYPLTFLEATLVVYSLRRSTALIVSFGRRVRRG